MYAKRSLKKMMSPAFRLRRSRLNHVYQKRGIVGWIEWICRFVFDGLSVYNTSGVLKYLKEGLACVFRG